MRSRSTLIRSGFVLSHILVLRRGIALGRDVWGRCYGRSVNTAEVAVISMPGTGLQGMAPLLLALLEMVVGWLDRRAL